MMYLQDVVKSNDVRSIGNYIRKNVSAGSEFRFMHFPMCHLGHWTLVVYDTEDGSWKHYNPMRQRRDRTDVHHTEAVKLVKKCFHYVCSVNWLWLCRRWLVICFCGGLIF